jgi:hypothetical protein
MTTGITGGLVPAYATLAANVFALTALFGALSKAASLRLLEEGLLRVGNAAGQNLAYVADGLKRITGAAISTEAAMRSVALATSAGFSTSQLEGLTKVAKGASVALGRDMGDAMDRLVRGTAKLEPEILDELGIMVRLDDATAEYAISLGKTSDQLTQFERRMAFLNATVEQGTAKFGALADNTKVNPYDKLAASFANLAKVGVNLLNVVVEPLVNFLSGNPLALTAAVTMFAGTLVNQIVPAITASADAARNMAKATHKEAIRLAKKTESSFKVVAGKIKSLDFAPKSIKKIEADLQAGKIKGKELQQALRNITQSEKLRTAALKNTTKQNITQKQAELSSVIALRKEIEATAAAEGRRGASSGALGKAKGMSSTSRKTAAAFKMMEGAGPADGFRIAAASVGKQSKDIGKATGALNKLTLGFRVAGNGAKLFGTALLNAVPIIGQLIFAASILWPLLSKLIPEKTAVAEAADRATKSFSSFNDIAEQLGKTLATSSDEVADFVSRLNVQTGIMDQLASAFKAMEEAQKSSVAEEKADAVEKESKQLKKVLALQDKIAGLQSQEVLTLFDQFSLQNSISNLEIAQEKLVGISETTRTAVAALEEFDRASGLQVINSAIHELKNSGLEEALGEDFKGTQDAFNKIKTAIDTGFFPPNDEGVAIAVTYENIAAAITEANKPAAQLKASIEAASQVTNDFLKEITKLGTKDKTPIDPMLESLATLNKEYTVAIDKGTKAQLAFEKGSKGFTKILDDFSKMEKRDRKGADANLKIHDRLKLRLEENRDIMILSSREAKRITDQNKALSKVSKENGPALQLILDNEELIRKEKEKALNAELDSYNIVGLSEAQSKRVLEIEQEKGLIAQDRILSSQDQLKVDVANIGHKQKILGLTTQIAAAEKQIALDGMKRAENQARMAKMKAGKEFTPADELEQFKATEQKRKQLIFQEMSSKLHAIELEKQLIIAQTKLQKARATIVENELKLKPGTLTKPFDDLLAVFPNVFQAKMNAVVSSALTQSSDVDLEGATKTRAVQTAVSGAATGSSAGGMGGTDTTYGRLTNVNEQGGMDALTDPQEKLAAMKGMVDPMLENLRSLGPEGELVAAVTAGSFAMADSFMTMGENLKNASDGLGKGAAVAQMAGQAFAQIGAIATAASKAKVAGIDKEIQAEKKRDGTSAASLAKIKAMEKKKEAIKRKEFEMNKKMQMGQVVANTAAGIMGVMSGIKDPLITAPLALAQVALIGAMGAAQLATIAGTSFQGGGSIGSAGGGMPSKISIGQRNNTVDLAKSKSASGELGYMRGEDGVGGAGNFRPAFSGYKHRAGGGYVVGEQGPEVFMPDVPGEIVASGQGTGGMTNVSFNINTVDATGVEELLIGQKGNIIGMIRDAANSYGESFMDGVDTTVYNKTTEGVSKY